ncbi:MAG: DUF3343 domain-containing protein [Planctomycetota bacterium]|nr:MAG: DUF3343 domain-containing protein [Planctomycetota bacterium]
MHDVILVQSTTHAIRIEKLLKKAELQVKLVPVPRHLSSDCGVAVRILADERNRCEEILSENSTPFEQIASLKK